MYQNWVKDQQDEAELAKNHAYLVGSFWNPEAVKQLMAEGAHKSTDVEFEESTNIVREFSKNMEEQKKIIPEKKKGKKKRHRIKG